MKILLVGSFKFEIYASAFAHGFRILGHDVIEIDYEKYHLKENGALANFLNKVQDRFHYGIMMRKYNEDIVHIVEIEKPDLVFLYRCYHVYPSTLRRIKSLTTLFSYNNDDPFSGVPSEKYYRYHIADSYLCDLNFVYRKKNIVDYESLGIHNTQVLLPYYLEKKNFYKNIPDDLPIVFAGHFEDDGRDQYIKTLLDNSLSVIVFNGSYWEKSPLYAEIKDIIKPAVRSLDYNHLLNRCQIALVFLSKLNNDTYTRRCFEIPATKTLMLCEFTEDMNKLFPADECAVYFKSAEELVEKSKYLLSHPEEIKRIANNGYERLKELGASEVERCREIINIYIKMKNDQDASIC